MKGKPNTTPAPPKQQRSIETRKRIFRAAVGVFSRKGLDGARVDEIARHAKVNKQRIYAYFGSKGELYRQVLIDVYSGAATNARLLGLTPNDIPEMTGTIVEAFFEIHENDPRFWRLLCWENLNGGKGLRAEDWRDIRNVYISHLEQLYTTGQERGMFRADIGFTTYLMLLFSMTYFYFSNQLTMSHLLNLTLGSDAVRQKIETEFLGIMAEGLRAGAHGC